MPALRYRRLAFAASLLLLLSATMATAQPPATSPTLRGRTALVTGSTDGLGRELALTLARAGAHVIVHGRNAERGQSVVAEITAAGGSARFFAADFASLDAVRAFADTIARTYPRLDLLISNAGVLVPQGEGRRTSTDGHELHFAVNYLPGWILAHRLRPALKAAQPSRVISVASIAQSPIDFADVMLERAGASPRGYGQSKLAQVTMTNMLAPEFAADGITMVSLHPATMMNTTMVRQSGMPARTTVTEGHDAVMALVRATTLDAGAYYNGERRATPHAQASDAAAQAALRALSERLTRVP
jgi:NAD(P)-dependent dehydrogenase (short-subunit alcohol dehydrogenase family)